MKGELHSKIRVLPPSLADLIAAGEVVERPASVVKELCENAIDASATRITVEAEDGGVELIRVIDNGCGMNPEDAVLSLRRHATSKIVTARDLETINTLGFRGEALPSIASVSRLEIVTRPKEQDAGARIETSASGEPAVSAAGCAPGTIVSVKTLFYNVPARKKFLKKAETEEGHIQETLIRIALTRPDIGFRLVLNGRQALDLPVHPDLQTRSEAVLSRRAKGRLYPGRFALDETRVTVLTAAPSAAVGTSRWCYLFVNGRFVRDRMLLRSLVSGYGHSLASGRYPVAVAHIELPPDLVDVNVHPQKTEVRFVRPSQAAAAVHKALSETVSAAPWSIAARTYVLGKNNKGGEEPGNAYTGEEPDVQGERRDSGSPFRERAAKAMQETFADYSRSPSSFHGRGSRAQSSSRTERENEAPPRAWFETRRQNVLSGEAEEPAVCRSLAIASKRLGPLVYLGQALKTFLVFEGNEGLVLLDQHAAHERINYNRIIKTLSSGNLPGQRLLAPERIELSPEALETMEEQGEEIRRLGFEAEPFGGGSVALKAVPVTLSEAGADGGGAFLDLLDEMVALGGKSSSAGDDDMERGCSRIETLAASLACHASIRAGQALEAAEVTRLLKDMDEADPWDHCPHGRPVILHLSENELRRRFGRS